MEITNDEYIAVIQSEANKPIVTDQIKKDASYRHRTSDFRNMPETDFKSIRAYHMTQLFNAYKEAYDGRGYHHFLSISATTTKVDDIRRVIGPKAGSVSYDGPMALDYETIQAVCHLASLRGFGHRLQDSGSWVGDLSYTKLVETVDEMIAVKNLFAEKTNNPSLKLGSKIYSETDLAKRAIEKTTGTRAFKMKDHELSADELISRKTNIFKKTMDKFTHWWGKANNPKDSRFDENRLGNQTQIVDVEGR